MALGRPRKRNDSSQDDLGIAPEDGQVESQGTDILLSLGINSETQPPPGVLTPDDVRSMRFRISAGEGYLYEDVEAMHTQFAKTLDWLTEMIHHRDLDVHKLATELDRMVTDFQNQKFQMEMFRARSGRVLVDENDELVTEASTEGELYRIREELDQANAQAAEFQEWAEQVQEYVAGIEAQLAEKDSDPQSENIQTQKIREPLVLDNDDEDEFNETSLQLDDSVLLELQSKTNELEDQVENLHAQLIQAQNVANEATNATRAAESEIETLISQAESAAAQAEEEIAAERAATDAATLAANEAIEAANAAIIVPEEAQYKEESLSDEEREQYEALKVWAEQVESEYNSMEERLVALEQSSVEVNQKLQEAKAYGVQMEAYTADLNTYVDQLENGVEPSTQVEDEITVENQEIAQTAIETYETAEVVLPQATLSFEVDEDIEDEVVEDTSRARVKSLPSNTVAAKHPALFDADFSEADEEPEEEDSFARTLADMRKSEVPTGSDLPSLNRRPQRGGYVSSKAGAPLTSLPAGADISKYL